MWIRSIPKNWDVLQLSGSFEGTCAVRLAAVEFWCRSRNIHDLNQWSWNFAEQDLVMSYCSGGRANPRLNNVLLLFTDFHVVLPNAAKYTNKLDKKIVRKSTRLPGMEVDYRNYSSSKFLSDRISRNQNCHCGKILNLIVVIFLFTWYFLLSPLLTFFPTEK